MSNYKLITNIIFPQQSPWYKYPIICKYQLSLSILMIQITSYLQIFSFYVNPHDSNIFLFANILYPWQSTWYKYPLICKYSLSMSINMIQISSYLQIFSFHVNPYDTNNLLFANILFLCQCPWTNIFLFVDVICLCQST